MSYILEVKNLNKVFKSGLFKIKQFKAIDNITFNLKSGEILGLLGSNGAGKTTLMQMLLSTLTPTSGEISYFGQCFEKNRSEILKKIGFASSYTKLPPNLLVKENLTIIGRLYGLTEKRALEKSAELLNILKMPEIFNKKNGVLSAGQSAVVQIVKALIIEPKIVILDEPMAALDVEAAQRARDLLKIYRKDCGLSIIITSHNMEEVEQLVDRVLIVKSGKLIADSTPDELIRQVKTAHIELYTDDSLKLETYLSNSNFKWVIQENEFKIKIDEQLIPDFLNNLLKLKITYTQISIKRPTLEDYFFAITNNETTQLLLN